MKNIIIACITLLLITSCHKYDNTKEQKDLFASKYAEPLDTLLGTYIKTTSEDNLEYFQGKLHISNDTTIHSNDTKIIKVCGNFPKDLLDIKNPQNLLGVSFKIIGKVIKLEDTHSGKVPVFYVKEWKKFYFNRSYWSDKGELNLRSRMIDNVLENIKLEGETLSSIIAILGEPDFREPGTIIYTIDLDYGYDIDPIDGRNLEIMFNQDNIITNKQIKRLKN